MSDSEIIQELEKLHNFLDGCHLATENLQAKECFYRACHLVDEIIHSIELS